MADCDSDISGSAQTPDNGRTSGEELTNKENTTYLSTMHYKINAYETNIEQAFNELGQ